MNNGEGNGIRTIVNYVCRKYKIRIIELFAVFIFIVVFVFVIHIYFMSISFHVNRLTENDVMEIGRHAEGQPAE